MRPLRFDLTPRIDLAYGRGEPCKPGEAASRTGCIPASGERGGGDEMVLPDVQTRNQAEPIARQMRFKIQAEEQEQRRKYVEGMFDKMSAMLESKVSDPQDRRKVVEALHKEVQERDDPRAGASPDRAFLDQHYPAEVSAWREMVQQKQAAFQRMRVTNAAKEQKLRDWAESFPWVGRGK